MESNKLYLYSYIDMEVNWLRELVKFNIITIKNSEIEVTLECVRQELYNILGSGGRIYDFKTTVEETLKLVLAKYNLNQLIPAVGLAITKDQKEEITLALFTKKTVLSHTQEYDDINRYVRDYYEDDMNLLTSSLRSLRYDRPHQDMRISAIQDYIVNDYFASLSIGQEDNASLYKYVLDSLYNMHNFLITFDDPEYQDSISFTITMIRGCIKELTDSFMTNSPIRDYFFKELFTAMDLYNAIIEKTTQKEKLDIKQLRKK